MRVRSPSDLTFMRLETVARAHRKLEVGHGDLEDLVLPVHLPLEFLVVVHREGGLGVAEEELRAFVVGVPLEHALEAP